MVLRREIIECVKQYKYLGFFITTFSWSMSKMTLAAQANKALGMLYMYNYKCKGLPHEMYLNIFDKMILPILLYGSEIWGFKYSDKIEQVKHIFCKKLLGLSSNTVNEIALGEMGRYPLAVHHHLRCVKYWLEILSMQSGSHAIQPILTWQEHMAYVCESYVGTIRFSLCMCRRRRRRFYFIYRDI